MRTCLGPRRRWLAILLALVLFGPAAAAGDLFTPQSDAKVTASDASQDDEFGEALTVDRDTLVVGAPDEKGGEGAAYVYSRSSGAWIQDTKLTGDRSGNADFFGATVDVSGDTIVIGAWADDSAAPAGGAVYVFERSKNRSWSLEATLTADDAGETDNLGWSLDLHGDTIIAGAAGHDAPITNAGAVYVFEEDSTGAWSQTQKLTETPASKNAFFGSYVALDDDRLIALVGDDELTVFDHTMGTWVQTAQFDIPPGVRIGGDIDLDEDVIVVGAPEADAIPDEPRPSGAVYVWTKATGGWNQTVTLTMPNPEANRDFGNDVAFNDGLLAVGAPFDSTAALGAGAVYTYVGTSGVFALSGVLLAEDASRFSSVGESVGLDDGIIVAGAPGESSQADDAGAAYVWDGVIGEARG